MNELALEVAGKHHDCVVTAQILGGAFLNIANTHSVSNLLGLLLGAALIVDGAALRRVTGPVAGLANGVAAARDALPEGADALYTATVPEVELWLDDCDGWALPLLFPSSVFGALLEGLAAALPAYALEPAELGEL